MSKDPAFLFYYQAWMVGTFFLNRKQKGAYIDLLCFQADKGNLTIDIIKEILNSDFEECWPKIKDKFVEENGIFYNKRLREEQEKRAKHIEHQKENINKRWNVYRGNTTVLPLTNTNTNTNKDIIKDKDITKDKEEEFKKEVLQFKNYPLEMLNEFIGYWTEPNKTKTKLRYELEKTWDTGRRLGTWARNNKQFKKPEKKFYQRKEAEIKDDPINTSEMPESIKKLAIEKTAWRNKL